MRTLVARTLLLLLAASALPAGWRVGHWSDVAAVESELIGRPEAVEVRSGPMGLDTLDMLAEHDPFRISRRPAAIGYDPLVHVNPEVAVAAPRPPLTVTGVSVGRETSAIVEGLPGLDGPQVVVQGQRIGGLRVRRITREAVVIEGADTTWNLRIREPWQ